MKRKLEVGQSLWWVPSRRHDAARSVVVKKIGRKWADVGLYWRVDVETLWADGGDYSSPGRCYLSRDEYEATEGRNRAYSDLRNRLLYACPEGVTMEAIKEAARLLGIPEAA